MPKKPLAPKRAKFIDEYLVDLNGTQAAIRAGYSPRVAAQEGNRLLRNAQIKAIIEQKRADQSKKTGVDAERVMQELARVGFIDMRDVAEWDADGVRFKDSADLSENVSRAIQAVKSRSRTTYDDEGHPTTTTEMEVRLYPKGEALTLIGRHLAMWNDKMRVDGLEGIADAIAQARARAKR